MISLAICSFAAGSLCGATAVTVAGVRSWPRLREGVQADMLRGQPLAHVATGQRARIGTVEDLRTFIPREWAVSVGSPAEPRWYVAPAPMVAEPATRVLAVERVGRHRALEVATA